MMVRYRLIFISSLVAFTAWATPALAAPTAQEAYAPPGGTEQSDVQKARDPGGAASASRQAREVSGSRLPFTGLDIALVLFAGLALLLLGAVLARVARPAGRRE